MYGTFIFKLQIFLWKERDIEEGGRRWLPNTTQHVAVNVDFQTVEIGKIDWKLDSQSILGSNGGVRMVIG